MGDDAPGEKPGTGGARWAMSHLLPGTRTRLYVAEDAMSKTAPECRVLAMDCIATWSLAEKARIGLVAVIARANPSIVARDLFSERMPTRQQCRMLKFLGNAVLDGESRDTFLEILRRSERVETTRNELAHGIWAAHLPEGGASFSLLDPRTVTDTYQARASGEVLGRAIRAARSSPADKGKQRALARAEREFGSARELRPEDVMATHDPSSLRKALEDLRSVNEMMALFLMWQENHSVTAEHRQRLLRLLRP